MGIHKIENEIQSLGIDLTIIESLANIIEGTICEEYNINNVDIANLTIVLKRLIKIVKSKCDNIESYLNI